MGRALAAAERAGAVIEVRRWRRRRRRHRPRRRRASPPAASGSSCGRGRGRRRRAAAAGSTPARPSTSRPVGGPPRSRAATRRHVAAVPRASTGAAERRPATTPIVRRSRRRLAAADADVTPPPGEARRVEPTDARLARRRQGVRPRPPEPADGGDVRRVRRVPRARAAAASCTSPGRASGGLQLDDGELVELDHELLIGRNPDRDDRREPAATAPGEGARRQGVAQPPRGPVPGLGRLRRRLRLDERHVRRAPPGGQVVAVDPAAPQMVEPGAPCTSVRARSPCSVATRT